jgi:hypothetical protein
MLDESCNAPAVLMQLFRVLNERLVVLDCYLKLARRFGYSGYGRKRVAVVVDVMFIATISYD